MDELPAPEQAVVAVVVRVRGVAPGSRPARRARPRAAPARARARAGAPAAPARPVRRRAAGRPSSRPRSPGAGAHHDAVELEHAGRPRLPADGEQAGDLEAGRLVGGQRLGQAGHPVVDPQERHLGLQADEVGGAVAEAGEDLEVVPLGVELEVGPARGQARQRVVEQAVEPADRDLLQARRRAAAGSGARRRRSARARELRVPGTTCIVVVPSCAPSAQAWTTQSGSAAARSRSSAAVAGTGSKDTIRPRKPASRRRRPNWPRLAPTSRTQSTPYCASSAATWAWAATSASAASTGHQCSRRPARSAASTADGPRRRAWPRPARASTTAPEPARCTSTPSAPSARRAPRRRATAALTRDAPRGCAAAPGAAGCARAGRSSVPRRGSDDADRVGPLRRGRPGVGPPAPPQPDPAAGLQVARADEVAHGPAGRVEQRDGDDVAPAHGEPDRGAVAQRVAVGREARRDVRPAGRRPARPSAAGRRRGPRPRRARRPRARAARGGSCRAAAQAADLDERAGPLVGRARGRGPSSRRSRRARGPARRGRARPGRGRRSRGPAGGSSGAPARCPPRAPGRG